MNAERKELIDRAQAAAPQAANGRFLRELADALEAAERENAELREQNKALAEALRGLAEIAAHWWMDDSGLQREQELGNRDAMHLLHARAALAQYEGEKK